MYRVSRLREIRRETGWSLGMVVRMLEARGCRITKASLSNYEMGKRAPRADLLGEMASLYGVRVDFFYN